MSENLRILRMLRRALFALPFVLACMVIAILVARKTIGYMTPHYEAVARIKLDESSYGVSSTNLFKDFDVFSATSKIAAEVELLQSETILAKVAGKLNADHSLFRVGNIRETELGVQRPFTVAYQMDDPKWQDRNLSLEVEPNGNYTVNATIRQQPVSAKGVIGIPLSLDGLQLTLLPGTSQNQLGESLDLEGQYRLRFHSAGKQVSLLRNGGLDITASDEEVPILRIAFKHSSPEYAAQVANTIAETYIEDHIAFKTQAASLTLKFIDQQIAKVGESLETSEAALETYRDNEGVINTRQETETNLRKIAEMKIQLANIEMREKALDSLDQYINAGDMDFQDLAPSFEAFGDLLFTELLKKIKAYEAERIDLLINFTEESRAVKAVDEKIAETTSYIKESIRNARRDIEIKRASIAAAITESEKDFEGLPARDRQMVILDRDFQLNQKLYLFLMEKRMESSIQESASMSFHRIIERARVPETPVSPKPAFVTIVAGFLGLVLGVGIIALRSFFNFQVKGTEGVEQRSTFPVLGTLPWQAPGSGKSKMAVGDLVAKLLAREDAEGMRYIAVASQEAGVGKSYLASEMARSLAAAGRKVALLDLDLRKEEETKGIAEAISTGKTPQPVKSASNLHLFPAGNLDQHPNAVLQQPSYQDWWKSLADRYEFVLVDTSNCEEAAETLAILQSSELVVWMTLQGKSKLASSSQPDVLETNYGIGPFVHVINGIHERKNAFQTIGSFVDKIRSGLASLSSTNKTEAVGQ